MNLISIVIINYNNRDYLKRCIASINNQSYKNLEIIFIDNDSSDNSYEYMISEFPKINIIKNTVNNGYAGAANQGIKLSKGKYVMIINPDIIMEEDFVEKLYNFIETDENIAAVSGKLLKYDFKNDKKLNYIDSAGIVMFQSTMCSDRGQNQEDAGQYDKIEQVFGVCGAAPLYRKSALEKIKINDEYFDEDFFAYKEDVDLSWRLNLYGFKNMYYPKAVAYHGRGFGKNKKGILNFVNSRKKQSEFLRGLSHRNHKMMLYKNFTSESYKKFSYKIIKRELTFDIYAIIFERFIFKYSKEAKHNKSKMKDKQRIMLENSKGFKNIENLFS